LGIPFLSSIPALHLCLFWLAHVLVCLVCSVSISCLRLIRVLDIWPMVILRGAPPAPSVPIPSLRMSWPCTVFFFPIDGGQRSVCGRARCGAEDTDAVMTEAEVGGGAEAEPFSYSAAAWTLAQAGERASSNACRRATDFPSREETCTSFRLVLLAWRSVSIPTVQCPAWATPTSMNCHRRKCADPTCRDRSGDR
jgi:hypothetical protein